MQNLSFIENVPVIFIFSTLKSRRTLSFWIFEVQIYIMHEIAVIFSAIRQIIRQML